MTESTFFVQTYGLLICTLISENQGLEKSRSISNPRKISGLQTLIFFPGLPTEKSWVYTIVIYLPFFEDAGDRLTTEFRLTPEEVASLRVIEVPTGKLENAKTR